MRTELDARVEIQQLEELEVFGALRLSVEVLAEVLPEVLADVAADVAAEAVAEAVAEVVAEAVAGLGYRSGGLDTN